MRVLSFCLYGGEKPPYAVGALKNAQLKQKYFPDWEMRLYHDNSVSKELIDNLKNLDVNCVNIEDQDDNLFYPREGDSKTYGMFWRFLPASDENVEYFVSRDCDSRFSEREVTAVNEWIESDKPFHIIRDHPQGHGWEINGGMWGSQGGFIEDISESIRSFLKVSHWAHEIAADQRFLKECIYPVVKDYAFVHDEYFRYEPQAVPIKRDRKLDDFSFIGEPFDENDNQVKNYRDVIIQLYKG